MPELVNFANLQIKKMNIAENSEDRQHGERERNHGWQQQ
jgi:hypothetical protein